MDRRKFLGLAGGLAAASFACTRSAELPNPTPSTEASTFLLPGHPADISCGSISNFTGIVTVINKPAFDTMLQDPQLGINIPSGIEIAIVLGPFSSDTFGAWEKENPPAVQIIKRTVEQSRTQKPPPLHREYLTVPMYKFLEESRSETNPKTIDHLLLADIITTQIFTRLQELTTGTVDVNAVIDVLGKNQRPIMVNGVSQELLERIRRIPTTTR